MSHDLTPLALRGFHRVARAAANATRTGGAHPTAAAAAEASAQAAAAAASLANDFACKYLLYQLEKVGGPDS